METPLAGRVKRGKVRFADDFVFIVMRWYVLMKKHGRKAGARKLNALSKDERDAYTLLQGCFKKYNEAVVTSLLHPALCSAVFIRFSKNHRLIVRAAIMDAGRIYSKDRNRNTGTVAKFKSVAKILYRSKHKKRRSTAKGETTLSARRESTGE